MVGRNFESQRFLWTTGTSESVQEPRLHCSHVLRGSPCPVCFSDRQRNTEDSCAAFTYEKLNNSEESAPSVAADRGAKEKVKPSISVRNFTPQSGVSAISNWAKPAHKLAARSLGYALTTGDETGWACFTALVYTRLSVEERAALAYAALMALDECEAELTVDAVWGYACGAAA